MSPPPTSFKEVISKSEAIENETWWDSPEAVKSFGELVEQQLSEEEHDKEEITRLNAMLLVVVAAGLDSWDARAMRSRAYGAPLTICQIIAYRRNESLRMKPNDDENGLDSTINVDG
eukprot:scaffold4285_cov66-Attheya_sp.AAC.1